MPSIKIPKTLLVTFAGPRGGQTLLISVAAEDGSLIPGFVGTILEEDGTHESFETDIHGRTVHKIGFIEPSRYIEVRAGNSPNLVWRARLLGPKRPSTGAS